MANRIDKIAVELFLESDGNYLWFIAGLEPTEEVRATRNKASSSFFHRQQPSLGSMTSRRVIPLDTRHAASLHQSMSQHIRLVALSHSKLVDTKNSDCRPVEEPYLVIQRTSDMAVSMETPGTRRPSVLDKACRFTYLLGHQVLVIPRIRMVLRKREEMKSIAYIYVCRVFFCCLPG
jgi:hypothetical protein